MKTTPVNEPINFINIEQGLRHCGEKKFAKLWIFGVP